MSLRRYISFFRPFQPRLNRHQHQLLLELEVLQSRFPFPIVQLASRSLLDLNGVPYASTRHHQTEALSHSSGEAVLKSFFSTFQPKTLSELWGLEGYTFDTLVARNFGHSRPFGTSDTLLPFKSEDCAHFGPALKELITREFERLLGAARGLRSGYRPWTNWDGFIRGVLLSDGRRYVFLVTAGKHRSSQVAALDRVVSVRLDWNKGWVPVVDTRRLDLLPQVKKGLWSIEDAEAVAHHFLAQSIIERT